MTHQKYSNLLKCKRTIGQAHTCTPFPLAHSGLSLNLSGNIEWIQVIYLNSVPLKLSEAIAFLMTSGGIEVN